MTEAPTVIAARARAVAARQRLTATVAEAKARLSPKAVARSAIDDVKARAMDGVAAAARHPGTLAAIVGAIGLLLARRPLLRLVRRDATPGDPDS